MHAMSSMPGHILVVEDDRRMADTLVSGLTNKGYQVTLARTGEEAFFVIHSTQPDLVLLDLTLPQRGGLEILAQIRAERLPTRVLILTSHNSVDDRVTGLNSGADDYLGKPHLSFPELLAQSVASLLRRLPSAPRSSSLQIADVHIDTKAHLVNRSGTPIDLTPREYDLLLYLLEHRNQASSSRDARKRCLARDLTIHPDR